MSIYRLEVIIENDLIIEEFFNNNPTKKDVEALILAEGYSDVLLRNGQTQYVGIQREIIDYSNGLENPVYLEYTERKEVRTRIERIELIEV